MRKLLAIITIAILILSCSNKENKNNDKQKGIKIYSETESKITVSYTHLTLPTNREV